MSFASAVSSCVVGLALSNLLQGCGTGSDSEVTTSSAMTTSEQIETTTITTTTSTNDVADKNAIYVVLRMDDIATGTWVADRMTDSINWAIETQNKFNFGLIANGWPADCSAGCADSPAVKRVFDAYKSGDILGTGGSELLEIGCHSYDHENWPNFYTSKTSVRKDMKQSMDTLNAAFPNASIRTFTPPQNLANMDVLKVAADHGMDILTSQGTMSCSGDFVYFPCADCRPNNDIFVTADGFQKVSGTNVFSTPTGSANSVYPNEAIGISAKDTLGVKDCGCRQAGDSTICAMVQNAKANAKKSNGVQWTVLMMHPQTMFPGGGTYRKWLDEFHEEVKKSGLDIRFIHFQDLVKLMAPAASMTI